MITLKIQATINQNAYFSAVLIRIAKQPKKTGKAYLHLTTVIQKKDYIPILIVRSPRLLSNCACVIAPRFKKASSVCFWVKYNCTLFSSGESFSHSSCSIKVPLCGEHYSTLSIPFLGQFCLKQIKADQMHAARILTAGTSAHGLNDQDLASFIKLMHLLHLVQKTRCPVINVHAVPVQDFDYLAKTSPDEIFIFPKLRKQLLQKFGIPTSQY